MVEYDLSPSSARDGLAHPMGEYPNAHALAVELDVRRCIHRYR